LFLVQIVVTIKNPTGLHARPAAAFVQAAERFEAAVWLEKDGRRVNAKSILSVMSLGAKQGTSLKLVTDGKDEAAAAATLRDLIERGLGEMVG